MDWIGMALEIEIIIMKSFYDLSGFVGGIVIKIKLI